ncbi:hypothetical protein ASF52_17850 [Methylobacterium sp. Leaf112]|nr:hypothetical protein ASF52_17850 [Methylobacterium sp. Leaf112]
MSLPKDCADHLRSNYKALTGKKLGSGHAHEIVAAYFGYPTAAALQAERRFPLDAMAEADFLIPDLRLMDGRVRQIQKELVGPPDVNGLASVLGAFIVASGHFAGEVWLARQLDDEVNDYVQRNPAEVEEALSGEMATTNAYFDEIYIDECDVQPNPDALVVTVSGSMDGENDPDQVYHGDKILFTSVLTFERVSGRVGYARPEFDTSGGIDTEGMYDYEDA